VKIYVLVTSSAYLTNYLKEMVVFFNSETLMLLGWGLLGELGKG
jgi:hypothetical protein